MLNSEDRDDLFFDSVDCLSTSEEEFDGGFWSNELKSVKERREAFLRKLGSVDSGDSERISEKSETVTSFSAESNETVETPVYCEREENGEANAMSDWSDQTKIVIDFEDRYFSAESDDRGEIGSNKKGNWWRKMATKSKVISTFISMASKENLKAKRMSQAKVQVKNKRFKELSALYIAQEFRAHKGLIRTAKFSPDGQYLATGGEDGVVRIWLVDSAEADEKKFLEDGGRNVIRVPVMIPDQVFQLNEKPVHEFRGHSGEIIDLAWSNSNMVVSSSSDCTVRLWCVGSDDCLRVYRHPNFVTCVQFNPIDDGCFISGSIDGKIRLWTVSEGRVLDWDDTRGAVTAISYQSDGKGLVVGCFNGSCRFYDALGCSLELTNHVQLPRTKKPAGNSITGLQFCPDDPQRLILTSRDLKVRVYDKADLLHKLQGSSSQTSASLTPNGRHIVSTGEDSRVYMWNNDLDHDKPAKRTKPIRSYEHFHSDEVSVAVPWFSPSNPSAPARVYRVSTEGSASVGATWPEEMLPPLGVKEVGRRCFGGGSAAWGLVIVTAGRDGVLRVFHNYGIVSSKA